MDSEAIKAQCGTTPAARSRESSSGGSDRQQSGSARQEPSHPGGSRMILFNPAKTASRVLETVTERKVREERGVWRSDGELLTVACSSVVGVSTLLHAPHLGLQTSGGAFLLMCVSCQLLFGAPLLLLEAALGQYSAHGLASLMPEMAPVFRGYAHAVPLSLVTIAVTYMPIVSSTALYSVEATRQPPVWTSCSNSYNSPRCYTHALDRDCERRGAAVYVGLRCLSQKEVCQPSEDSHVRWNLSSACVMHHNRSVTLNATRLRELRTDAGEEFFRRVPHAVLPWLGQARAAVALSLLVCWTVAALISQAGAVAVRYTLPLVLGVPLIVISVLLITLIQSHRAAHGAWRLLSLDAHSLVDARSWLNAARYTICSQSTGLGVNTFIYSRNMLTHNCKRSVLTLVTLNLAVSTLCVVFYAFLVGYQATNVGENVKDLNAIYVEHHALVRLTSALSALDNSRTWSVLMLVAIGLAGLGSVQILLLTVEASLRELGFVRGLSTRTVIFLLCVGLLVINALSTIPSSYFTCLFLYQHASVYISVLLSFTLTVAVNCTLGVKQLLEDIRSVMAVPMRRSWNYWRVSWSLVCPVALLVLLCGTLVEQTTLPPRRLTGAVSDWTLALSGVLAAGPLLLLLHYVFTECRRTGRLQDELNVCAPTPRWRPGLLDEGTIRERLSEEQIVAKSSHALMTPKSSLMMHVYSPVTDWSVEERRDEDVVVHYPPNPGSIDT